MAEIAGVIRPPSAGLSSLPPPSYDAATHNTLSMEYRQQLCARIEAALQPLGIEVEATLIPVDNSIEEYEENINDTFDVDLYGNGEQ